MSDTFCIIKFNVVCFIRLKQMFRTRYGSVTFSPKQKKTAKKTLRTFSKQIKILNQTNWWILQCIATNLRISEGLCGALFEIFFSRGLRYRVSTFLESQFFPSRFHLNTDDTRMEWFLHLLQENLTYTEFIFNTSSNVAKEKKPGKTGAILCEWCYHNSRPLIQMTKETVLFPITNLCYR